MGGARPKKFPGRYSKDTSRELKANWRQDWFIGVTGLKVCFASFGTPLKFGTIRALVPKSGPNSDIPTWGLLSRSAWPCRIGILLRASKIGSRRTKVRLDGAANLPPCSRLQVLKTDRGEGAPHSITGRRFRRKGTESNIALLDPRQEFRVRSLGPRSNTVEVDRQRARCEPQVVVPSGSQPSSFRCRMAFFKERSRVNCWEVCVLPDAPLGKVVLKTTGNDGTSLI